jgi:peroxiredoxin
MKWITTLAFGVSLLVPVAAATPPVPRPAGEFRFVDASGMTRNLSQYRGKVVVMQFLYTTCTHCQATARMLSKLQSELGSRGVQVLGIAFDPDAQAKPEAVRNFIGANGVTFPVGAASSESVLGYLGISLMERFMVPQIVIVDRKGMVRAQSEAQGSAELQDETHLRSLLTDLLQGVSPAARSRR